MLSGHLVGAEAPRGGPGSLVPPGEVRSYYGCPVLKPPVWKKEIAGYLFTGGLAGASSVLAGAAQLSGRPGLARAARRVALGGALVSPALLIKDLGRPARFFNMLRVVRPTSPMNMGSWLLSAYGSSAGPAWHEARGQLPFLFAAGAATSAGAAVSVLTACSAPGEAGPARRLALAGFVAEQAAIQAMERRLGPLASPYHEGRAGRWKKAADVLGVAGGLTLAAAGRRRRTATVAGAGLLLASALATRMAVFKAGFQSAEDPEATIGPQRARLTPG